MKYHKSFMWIGGASSSLIILWSSFDFCERQKAYFNQIKQTYSCFQKDVASLKDNLFFVRKHEKKLKFLTQIGWISPQNRLIAGEMIEKLQTSLNKVQYTFEPEIRKTLGKNYLFKMTKIIFEVGALIDTDIYAFISEILERFPGILSLRTLKIARTKEAFDDLKKNERPNFVVGEVIFEWFSMAEDTHER